MVGATGFEPATTCTPIRFGTLGWTGIGWQWGASARRRWEAPVSSRMLSATGDCEGGLREKQARRHVYGIAGYSSARRHVLQGAGGLIAASVLPAGVAKAATRAV